MPKKLKHPKKGLINIKNDDSKCFLWCHIRYLNPLNKNPIRKIKLDKTMANNNLDYKYIKFPVYKKEYKKIEKKNNICINLFALMYFVIKMT